MKRIAWALALALAGCESMMPTGGIPSPQEANNALNHRFAGRQVAEVVARYGMPASQFMSGNVRVLVWNTERTIQYHAPVTTVTTGSIGGNTPWLAAVPYRQTTTSTETYGEGYHCALQVGVRADGTVERAEVDGQMGACQNFMP